MDRRARRTRAAIFNATMDLLVEKGDERISVVELCERADINKSTFYLHYKSIEECLENCFDTVTREIVSLSKEISYEDIKINPDIVMANIMEEVEKNVDYIFRFKNSKICGSLIKELKEYLVKEICKNNNFTAEDNYYEYASISFAVAGLVDSIINPLPVFNKELLIKASCDMIRSHQNK